MKRLAIIALLGAVGLVAPAQADRPASPGKADRPDRSRADRPQRDRPDRPTPRRCEPRTVGFNASGRLVSAALTPTGPRRYSGTLVVDVKRANHGAPKGEQTYTLANARVRMHRGVDAAAPAAGSRVRLHGTITRLNRGCPTDGFTATTTIRKVDIRTPRPPQPPETAGR